MIFNCIGFSQSLKMWFSIAIRCEFSNFPKEHNWKQFVILEFVHKILSKISTLWSEGGWPIAMWINVNFNSIFSRKLLDRQRRLCVVYYPYRIYRLGLSRLDTIIIACTSDDYLLKCASLIFHSVTQSWKGGFPIVVGRQIISTFSNRTHALWRQLCPRRRRYYISPAIPPPPPDNETKYDGILIFYLIIRVHSLATVIEPPLKVDAAAFPEPAF